MEVNLLSTMARCRPGPIDLLRLWGGLAWRTSFQAVLAFFLGLLLTCKTERGLPCQSAREQVAVAKWRLLLLLLELKAQKAWWQWQHFQVELQCSSETALARLRERRQLIPLQAQVLSKGRGDRTEEGSI